MCFNLMLTDNIRCVAFPWARWLLRECSLKAKRLCYRTTTRDWKMISGPSWTTSQKLSKQQRYVDPVLFRLASLLFSHFFLLLSCVFMLLFVMKSQEMSSIAPISCPFPSLNFLRLCPPNMCICVILSHCFLSADRGWDTGFPGNPSRAGPLWDAR